MNKTEDKLCPSCNKNESEGMIPLFQKDGTVMYVRSECEECEKELIKEWI